MAARDGAAVRGLSGTLTCSPAPRQPLTVSITRPGDKGGWSGPWSAAIRSDADERSGPGWLHSALRRSLATFGGSSSRPLTTFCVSCDGGSIF